MKSYLSVGILLASSLFALAEIPYENISDIDALRSRELISGGVILDSGGPGKMFRLKINPKIDSVLLDLANKSGGLTVEVAIRPVDREVHLAMSPGQIDSVRLRFLDGTSKIEYGVSMKLAIDSIK